MFPDAVINDNFSLTYLAAAVPIEPETPQQKRKDECEAGEFGTLKLEIGISSPDRSLWLTAEPGKCCGEEFLFSTHMRTLEGGHLV